MDSKDDELQRSLADLLNSSEDEQTPKMDARPELRNILPFIRAITAKDSVEYLGIVKTQVKNLLMGKQVLVGGLVNSYSDMLNRLHGLWQKLEGDAPMFGKPLVHFIQEANNQLMYQLMAEYFQQVLPPPALSLSKTYQSWEQYLPWRRIS